MFVAIVGAGRVIMIDDPTGHGDGRQHLALGADRDQYFRRFAQIEIADVDDGERNPLWHAGRDYMVAAEEADQLGLG